MYCLPLHIKHHQIEYFGTQQNEIHYFPRYISFEIFCNCYYCPRATETRRSDQFGDVHQLVCMEKNLDEYTAIRQSRLHNNTTIALCVQTVVENCTYLPNK